jgi:two-component system, OmpR family, phosphate regulon sensor histidine kinase PhoR
VTELEAQLRFGAEFALFLVCFAGLAFALLRSDLLVERATRRPLVVLGFGAIGVAAFLRGALLLDDDHGALTVLRLGGLVALALASFAWRPAGGGRTLLWLGITAVVLGEAAAALADPGDLTTVADAARLLGALGLGAALVVASARSIPARIAASASAILLVVVTTVAVALSAVISGNVEDEAIRRYGARAAVEAQAVSDEAVTTLTQANVLAASLAGPDVRTVLGTLRDPGVPPDAIAGARSGLEQGISQLIDTVTDAAEARVGPTLVTDPDLRVVAAVRADGTVGTELAGSAVLRQAREQTRLAQSVAVVGDQPLAVAAAPVTAGPDLVAMVVTTTRLDESYLQIRNAPLDEEQAGSGLAIVGRNRVHASAGTVPEETTSVELAAAALDGGPDLSRTAGDRYVVARPVAAADGSPVAAVVLSVPRGQIDATREDLYRVLFLVAMGAATAALGLAALAGERIGSGLRRLTHAAGEIERGNLEVRAEVDTDDELGTLGATFDSMAGSLRSMTGDLRRAADEEAELRGRLQAVVAGMGEALLAVDAEARITEVNAAAEELFDRPARELQGRRVDEVVTVRGEDGSDWSDRLSRPVLEAWSAPAVIVQPGGREVPVGISAGTLRGPAGDVVGAVFVVRDVRREREVERMKTEFLANISHELRTPLTPIKGFSALLRSRDLPSDRTRGFAGEIHDAADQMERVIGQLVNFATISAGRLDLAVEPVEPRLLVDDAVRRWRERVDGSHRIERRVSRGLPTVDVDRTYLDQTLDELIDNAVKYSPDGGMVKIGATLDDAGGDGVNRLRITVADQGVGIPADRLSSVMEDFTQLDASATRRFGGLGLGLALVARIVRAHGGDLEAHSAPGQGSRFTLVLPIHPVEP